MLVVLALGGCSSAPERGAVAVATGAPAASPVAPVPATPLASESVPAAPAPASTPPPSAPPPVAPAPSPAPPAAGAGAPPADPLAPRPPLETPPPVGVPPCAPDALTVTDADAAYTADAVQTLFTLRTAGPDCQLPAAYPQVQLLDGAGAEVGVGEPGGRGVPAPGTTPLTLGAATSLSFFVATARDGACVPAATLVVTLPGTATAVRTATDLEVCAGALSVGPVQRLGDIE